jgi:hypothetical protein
MARPESPANMLKERGILLFCDDGIFNIVGFTLVRDPRDGYDKLFFGRVKHLDATRTT